MNEIFIAIRTIGVLVEGVKEAMDFLKDGQEIPDETLLKLKGVGNSLDSDLDDLISRRDSEEGE